jgi:hypothetical protein
MADLGSIGRPAYSGRYASLVGQYIPQYARRKITFVGGLTALPLYGVTEDATEGTPSPPSLKITHRGEFRFRWFVEAGANTISIKAKQDLNLSPYPRMRVLANAEIGVTETSASASAGTGWKTIGDITINPTSDGVVEVVIENRLDRPDSVCYFDNVQANGAQLAGGTMATWAPGPLPLIGPAQTDVAAGGGLMLHPGMKGGLNG